MLTVERSRYSLQRRSYEREFKYQLVLVVNIGSSKTIQKLLDEMVFALVTSTHPTLHVTAPFLKTVLHTVFCEAALLLLTQNYTSSARHRLCTRTTSGIGRQPRGIDGENLRLNYTIE